MPQQSFENSRLMEMLTQGIKYCAVKLSATECGLCLASSSLACMEGRVTRCGIKIMIGGISMQSRGVDYLLPFVHVLVAKDHSIICRSTCKV